MAKKADISAPYDLSGVPMFYADQPAGLAIGPHVSRITFGVSEDDAGDFPRPVVTVAIPTTALLSMVVDLSSIFESAKFKKDVAAHLDASAKKIGRGLNAEVSKALTAGSKSRPSQKRLPKPN